MNSFWNNVKSELNLQNKTQIDLAKYINLSVGTLRNKINLNVLPTLETTIKIAEYLNVTIEYLITGNNFPGLNDDEMEIIRLYKILPDDKKELIRMTLAAISV